MEHYVLAPPPPKTAKQIRRNLYFYKKVLKEKNRHLKYLTKQMEKHRVIYSNALLANEPGSVNVKRAERDFSGYVSEWNKAYDILDEIEFGVHYWTNELELFKQAA